MSSFSKAFEKKKFFQGTKIARETDKVRKPFVVIWHTPETSFLNEVIDALSSLNIPYILSSNPEKDLSKADMVIFLRSDPKLYETAFRELCVPVAPRLNPKTKDYNAILEQGNGFYFAPENKWEIFAALIRACETFQFPYDWENLLRGVHQAN